MWMGVIFKILHWIGTNIVDNDRFIRWVNGLERAYAVSLTIPAGKSSQAATFLCFKELSCLSMKIRLT